MALPIIGAAIGGLASVLGARSAARAQERANNAQMDLARETRDMTRADLAPWRDVGQNALNLLSGIYDPAQRGALTEAFRADPGYAFQLEEGQRAIDGSAAARGQLFSGATLAAQQRLGQGLADQQYTNYLSRLGSLAGMGQSAATGQATANFNAAQMSSNALAGIGNAQSAGAIGVGNAINDAIGNGIGIWGYQQAMGMGQPAHTAQPAGRWWLGGQ